MTTTLAVIIATFFAILGFAKIAAAPPMREAAEHLGFTADQYRLLGVLELAGAIGVVTGLRYPALGLAAAAALVMMMVGAAIAHARKQDSAIRILFPVATAALLAVHGIVVVNG